MIHKQVCTVQVINANVVRNYLRQLKDMLLVCTGREKKHAERQRMAEVKSWNKWQKMSKTLSLFGFNDKTFTAFMLCMVDIAR